MTTPNSMRAAICTAYGGPEVVQIVQVPIPALAEDAVRIRVERTTVESGDSRVRGARYPPGFRLVARVMLGLRRPRQPILGTVLAGEVHEVGSLVTRFAVGDRVVAFCGARFRAHAEYATVQAERALCAIPEQLSWSQAAALPFGGTTALYFLRDRGGLKFGESLLVCGASGSVGLAAVALAKHMGAHVTGVCSASHASVVRDQGADEVIDYAREDFAQADRSWDVIMDCVGNAPYSRCRSVLAPKGRLLKVVAGMGDLLKAPWQSMLGPHRVLGGVAPERREDLAKILEIAAQGALRPVIDDEWPFDQIRAAYQRVDEGHKVGSVVLTLG
ncbi:MAG: NAD(P)-dependent alcohol dehydrogenase [Planctomycetes bacterium]|nr:NAD(P)-dependent alcohol dehydrogenase [Planctomycetota bacterium]